MCLPPVSTRLEQIAEQAICYPERAFTTLAHHIDVEWLLEAHRLVNKNSAPGIDRITAKDYAANLVDNLVNLHERIQEGTYRATPARQVFIEKDDGGKRALAIKIFEDKIVERAVVMILEAIYEQDFYDFFYAYRPGRNPHQALKALRDQCLRLGIN